MTAQANVLAFPSAPKMEVVKADIDNGFFRLANELADSLCKVELSGRQYRVFMALIRKTYGYGKKYDWIVAEQLCQLMSYEGCPSHIRADIRELKARRMIVVDGRQMGPNPVISDWEMTKPSRPKTAHKRAETGPKMSRNQPVNEPKTACSYTTDSEQNRPKPARQQAETGPKNEPKTAYTKDNKDNLTKDIVKKARVKRATQAPTDFEITDELFGWACDNRITTDLVTETDKFLDYHRAKGSTFKCWKSAWRNWMRNSMKFAPKPTRQSQLNEYGAAGNSTVPGDVYGFHDTSWAQDLGI
ncbi:replication protein [Hahella aquimaris]|uniref:replication protein n=1 Tax=Hahella sp. HNIBRBA332 TaxID=3015983 RepID=UPI00273AA62C|nr:replication protein [Hahella sp. HNIBRBA332]WLQ15394.1 replication protein [Hahella sp. HNIBRBA332]